MIKLRLELDELIDESIKNKFYFGKSNIKGEGQLVIFTTNDKIVLYFSNIVFNKLTKKEIKFIKSILEPKMKEINELLKKYIKVIYEHKKIKNKLEENNISVGYNYYSYIIKNNNLEYRLLINDNITIKNVNMNISSKEKSILIFNNINNIIPLIKEYVNISKERINMNKKLNNFNI